MFAKIIFVVIVFYLCKGALCSVEQFPVNFLLYTRGNRIEAQSFTYSPGANNKVNIGNYNFDGSLSTRIIINGFRSEHSKCDWSKKMRDELLKHFNCNVVLVDWSEGSGIPYDQACENTRTAANATRDFIKVLQNTRNLSLDKVHLIGHSLGAHIAGFVGKEFNGTIGRITGLDPAGPGFNNKPPEDKLNHKNGQFVDVIHSDGTNRFGINASLGIIKNAGHLDFWPNDGYNQPGCALSLLLGYFTERTGLGPGVACNHVRAVDFYVASIDPKNTENKGMAHQCKDYTSYMGHKCDSKCIDSVANCAIIGEKAVLSKAYKDKTIHKRYYLWTYHISPYFVDN